MVLSTTTVGITTQFPTGVYNSPVVGYEYVRAYCVEHSGIVVDGWNFGNSDGLTISFVYHLYEKYNPVFHQSHLYYGGTYYD